MKRLLLFLTVILFSTASVHAQAQYDTLNVRQIAAGVFHYTVHDAATPNIIQIVEIDLTNPDLTIETIAANNSVAGSEVVSSMTTRETYEGHRIITGVNGDFFSAGPVHTQVINGELLKKPHSSRPLFGSNRLNELFIKSVTYNGKVIHNSNTLTINNVNAARGENELVFYNHFKGSNTGTNAFGTEVTLEVLDPWTVNGEVTAKVIKIESGVGSAELSDNVVVLSGHGTMAVALDGFELDDVVTIKNELTGAGIDDIYSAIGGDQNILTNGVKTGNWPEIHPRTAVGFNKDRTKLYLMVVDGRYPASIGMTLQQMGDYLLSAGAWDALNLDGGGSTTMVVHNEVVNIPVGTGYERPIANSLVIASSAPKLGTLDHVNLYPDFAKVYKTNTVQFGVEGSDANFYPAEADPSKAVYSVSPGFSATIDENGLLTPGNHADTGYVYMDYEGIKDSSLVIVKGITAFTLFPEKALTNTTRKIEFYTEAFDLDHNNRILLNTDIQWSVSNPEVGEVSENGFFTGKAEGITTVYAVYDALIDSAVITVEVGEGVVVLDDFETLEGWTLEGENINMAQSGLSLSDSVSTSGVYSLRVDYEYTYSGNPTMWLHLKKDFAVYGVPDSISVNVLSTADSKHLMDANITGHEEDEFNIRVKKYVNTSDFDFFPAFIDDGQAVVPGTKFFYPIEVKGISIKIDPIKQVGETHKGTFYLDDLRLIYPEAPSTSNELIQGDNRPNKFELHQNYPNPFNPSTNISFSLTNNSKVELKVFDLLGREVAVLVNQRLSSGTYNYIFDASALSSGVYFYQLKTASGVLSKKMTLIK